MEIYGDQNGNLLLLDDPGRVRSQIISVVCQIQRFDFDCNLVVTRKVIIRTCAPLLRLTADKDSNRLNRAPGKVHEIPGLLPVVYNYL
jgi:hypothetical protein